MFRRPHYIAFSLVLLLALVLLNLPAQTAAQFKWAVGGLFLPLFGLASSSQNVSEKAAQAILPRRVLAGELEKLRLENEQLKLRSMQTEDVWRENERLRQSLQWQNQMRWPTKLARVVGRDPANWWRTVQIDLGSRHGVRENFPVITAEGLVGRVSEVGYSRSQVVLVGDPNCHVAALVQETRENGVIAPSSSPLTDSSIVELTYLSRTSQLQPGQKVATSGLGGIFPKGIFIGTIVDSRSVGYGLYTEARVKLAVNVNRLEEVWVLFQ